MSTRRSFLRTVGLLGLGLGASAGAAKRDGRQGATDADFIAPLSHGESENDDLERTGATGFTTFTDTGDGTLDYRITAKNIENATQAHVHGRASRGETAGVVAFLFEFAGGVGGPEEDARDGPIDVSGTIEDEGLVEAIVEDPDQYYVNLHTVGNPSGEIRGQIRER